MKLAIASTNPGKIEEIRRLLPSKFQLISLLELGHKEEIEEVGETLKENARIKAETIGKKFKIPCLGDDTGLEITALNGKPGVYSARYAGEPANSKKNIEKVLIELKVISEREARFRTVLAFYDLKEFHFFEGIVEGEIISGQRGEKGFGYDAIFLPKGGSKTFAEMSSEEKNEISHRGRALASFKQFCFGIE